MAGRDDDDAVTPSELRRKLQLGKDQSLAMAGDLDHLGNLRKILEALREDGDDVASLFVACNADSLSVLASPIIASSGADHLTWVSYPKAGQLGTDLNRDVLAAFLMERGVRPVRQIALDSTWSALRFRPQ